MFDVETIVDGKSFFMFVHGGTQMQKDCIAAASAPLDRCRNGATEITNCRGMRS